MTDKLRMWQSATILFLVFFKVSHAKNYFDIIKSDFPSESLEVGDDVILSCHSNEYFEFCTWTHEKNECNFEYKRAYDDVKMMDCSNDLKDRISYVGDYKRHECSVKINRVQLADRGDWSCTIEKYAWGPARGLVAKRSFSLDIGTPAPGKGAFLKMFDRFH